MSELITDRDAAEPVNTNIKLGIEGFTYQDLYRPARLGELAAAFYAELETADASLHQALTEYLAARGAGYEQKRESEILIAAAPHLSRFVARLFEVERERERQVESVRSQDPIWAFKFFIARRALKKFTAEEAARLDAEKLDADLQELRRTSFPETLADDVELGVARMTVRLLELEKELKETARADESVAENLKLVEAWAAAHATQAEARARVRGWASFHFPHQLDYEHLVQIERPRADVPELMRGLDENLRRRDGFGLTDPRATKREVLDEVDYCLYCHERSKDSCSKGLHERDGSVKRNPLGIKLEGCPLDEKISEMHVLKKRGDSIAALALVMIDNPMCPGTGHRICNDCMKSCIFQKQEPVNIPQAETGILTDVLELPYGFEIYSLLTRWNPLNAKRPHALPYNGRNVLVVGLGPAGYTLAHYLLNEGFGVVGIDGLKIEPLTGMLTGDSGGHVPSPVRDVREIETPLDERVLAGFGGVSEYGITVRWDKNFLTLIHLTLARRERFRFYGGVRFGGTLNIEDA